MERTVIRGIVLPASLLSFLHSSGIPVLLQPVCTLEAILPPGVTVNSNSLQVLQPDVTRPQRGFQLVFVIFLPTS